MAFITGLLLVDAPASALNNAGADETARTENAVATKFIVFGRNVFPYVSAQAFRYWLRTTLERDGQSGWQAAPVYREEKVAYTDANPLRWWDDDLFGYMRAPSKRAGAQRGETTATPVSTEITRVSPFRVSTLVSVAPVRLVSDFGTMSRHDGDPVPHEHQFYRTVLKGLFSLDLHMAGTFSYRNRTVYRNLDDYRKEEAQQQGLEHLQDELCYRLPQTDRARRVAALLQGLAMLVGGAKQTIHYTDVTPAAILAMVTRGGNNPLQYVVGADTAGSLQVHAEGLAEVVRVWGDQMLSPLYVGWVQGFQDDQRQRLLESLNALSADSASPRLPHGFGIGHPREILKQLAQDLARDAANWMA